MLCNLWIPPPPPQHDVIMMYHFAQIKALSSGVNLNGWTFYFELIGCCRNPLNVSNSIRYSITIVQFNLSNLIGFDCSFLGHSPLNIQELWRYPQAQKKRKKKTPLATTVLCWQRWNSSLDGPAGSDGRQLDCHVEHTWCSCGASSLLPLKLRLKDRCLDKLYFFVLFIFR